MLKSIVGRLCCAMLILYSVRLSDIKDQRRDLVIRGLFGRHLGAVLGPSWNPIGAYAFDILKKQESNATAEKWGPAAGGQALGETLSKQVYLGRV